MGERGIFRAAVVMAAGMLIGVAALPRTASAHDDEHKRIGGLKLKMSYNAAKPEKQKFLFKTKDQIAIAGLTSGGGPITFPPHGAVDPIV